MATNKIDASVLRKLFLAGAANLESKKEWINDLNVFPVPDGDTGTNMTLTIMSAAKEVNGIDDLTMKTLSKAISSGSLRGARGNSGVILSQLFRGFTKEINDFEELDTIIISKAFQRAVETAYKAVMKPKEGTILTVARGMSDKAIEIAPTVTDIEEFFGQIIECGDDVLSKTPDMLPVLKQAGVVDSGGQGLMQVLKGAYDCMLGKEVNYEAVAGAGTAKAASYSADADETDIKFGYCTEFIILLDKEFNEDTEHSFKAYLESIGDSLVVVADDEIVKVHVHTNDPGLAIQKALKYGQLSKMKIDNMREEHHEKLIKEAEKKAADLKAQETKEPEKDYGFISVSAGDGLSEIFRGLGADYIIEGGQTMNPSTEDMLNAIDSVNAKNIFIFPNNSNIILAAQQAQAIEEKKNIIVVPTKTVPQGITALINFSTELSPEDNLANMTTEMTKVKTGQVTYAVRDTSIDDKTIKQGDIMGIGDKTILAVGSSIDAVTKDLIDELVDEDSELISLYYGSDISEEDANKLFDAVQEKYPDLDVEVNKGGQPVYYYILSVE